MQKEISPEEKLLSIIKGSKNRADDKNTGGSGVAAGESIASDARNKIDGYVSVILKNSVLKNTIFDPDALKAFNRYMVIGVFFFALFLFLNIIFVNPSRKAAVVISRISGSKARLAPEGRQMPVETKNYSYYSNKINGKNIFRGSSYMQTDAQEATESSGEAASVNLGLVGIVPGASPQAIVEDKKNQKTYYLIKGQSLDDITVDDISSDKVSLEYKGRKMTLLL